MKTKYTNLAIYLLPLWVLLLLATEKPPKSLFFLILILNYSFWRNLHTQNILNGYDWWPESWTELWGLI
jgi:hypothetical protein